MNIRSASSNAPPARRSALTRLRHFSSRHWIGFGASAVPCAGAGRLSIHPVFSQRLPRVWLHDRFGAQVALRRLLSVFAPWVHATSKSFDINATPTLGLGRSIRPTMGISHDWMRPSYCFRGATPTHWQSRPITFQSRFHAIRESGVSRLVSGGLDLTYGFPICQWSVADPDPWSCLPARKHSF